jgi:GNAT superfamily N-acetyltransferase
VVHGWKGDQKIPFPSRVFEMRNPESSVIQLKGYYPGVVGKVTELHAVYYHENWGFDVSFETQVAVEFSEFIIQYQEGRDGFWASTTGEKFSGCIAIDGRGTHTEGARLRWYIVVPRFQGLGIGRRLLREAIEFCRRAAYRRIYLWTFEGLNAARHLYERERFRLSEEHAVSQWGRDITEQMFELNLWQSRT